MHRILYKVKIVTIFNVSVCVLDANIIRYIVNKKISTLKCQQYLGKGLDSLNKRDFMQL